MTTERILLFLLASIQFSHVVDFMILMPLGPKLLRIFEITPTQFGILVSVYNFSAGISGFLGAFWSDRFDRRQTLLFHYAGFIVGTFACAFAPSYWFLLAARATAGAFGGVIGAQSLSIVGDVVPLERRARGMAIVMASFSAASVMGVPFGLYLAEKFSWHAPFLFLGLLSVFFWGLAYRKVPSIRGHIELNSKRSAYQIYSEVLGKKNQVIAMSLIGLLMFSQFLIIPFISPYLVFNVGLKESHLPLMYLFGGLCTIFSSQWVGRLADKHGRTKIFTIFALIALIPFLIMTHMPPLPEVQILILTSIFFIFTNGRFIPAITLVTSSVPSRIRGSFMSINSSLQSISAGLGAWLSGVIVTEGVGDKIMHYNRVGLFGAAVGLFAVWVGRRVKETE